MDSKPESTQKLSLKGIFRPRIVLLLLVMAGILLIAIPALATSQNSLVQAGPDFNTNSPGGGGQSNPSQLLQIYQLQVIPSSLQVLHSFNGSDGGSPNSLIQDSGGLLYGTAANGGDTISCPSDGCGLLFTIDPGGNYSILHTFQASDGYLPTGLIKGSDGNFYGTTMAGGQPSGGGSGTLFRIAPDGTLTTLYAFVGGFSCCDGGAPVGHPILASDGNYYGLTGAGGQFRDFDHPSGFGTFYQFNPNTNQLTILHSFNITDGNGIFPSGSLVQGPGGFMFGVTREGGLGGGTVYKLDAAGNITLLHAFTDSAQPLDGLILATDGFFYGTTDGGAGAGTIYRISPDGNYSLVNRFDGGDGFRPHFGLMQATDGMLYGTTPQGGLLDFQAGSLFRLDAISNVSVLHSFTQSDPVTGIIPNAVLLQASNGLIYGAAGLGGVNLHGTIFSFDPALAGPVASIMVDPATIITPNTATGTVVLASPAPPGGQAVDLRATSFNVTLPQSVTVPAGLTSVSFTIQASQVIQSESVRLYGSVAGEGIRSIFTLLPPGPTPTSTPPNTPTPTSTPLPPTTTPTSTPPPSSATPTAIPPTPTASSTPSPKSIRFFLPLIEK